MKNQWINIKKQKPAAPGPYEVWDSDDGIALVSHWNGEFFGMCSCGSAPMSEKVKQAIESKDEPTEYRLTKWRSLPRHSASL